jgi:glycosyltransferase involved in cell wall biosynthesis
VQRKFSQRNRILMDLLEQIDAIICPTRLLQDILKSRKIQNHQIYQISHGLDTSEWLPVHEDIRKDHIFRIGYMGQLDTHKGVHLIIEAAKQLHNDRPFEILIYGDEKASPNYVAFLKRLVGGDPRIKLMGRYKNEQVANILSQFDVLVIPSIWNEIGPWVMYEALEMRVPVISTNIPNMTYVIEHERNGMLFERGDCKDLHDQLERVMFDPSLLEELIAGIGYVKKIDEEMSELEMVYREIVAI